MKKVLSTLLVSSLLMSPFQAFAADDVNTEKETDAGITPDSIMYSIDKLLENAQISITFDSVDKAELFFDIAEERLAESKEMVDKEENDLSEATLEAYKEFLEKAIGTTGEAIEEGKEASNVAEIIAVESVSKEEMLSLILEELTDDFKDRLKEEIEDIYIEAEATKDLADLVENKDDVVETTDEDEAVDAVDNTETVEETDATDAVDDTEATEDVDGVEDTITEDVEEVEDTNIDDVKEAIEEEIANTVVKETSEDETILDRIQSEGLNRRQVVAIVSLSEQSGKSLDEVLDVFMTNEKGIGSTAHALDLTAKEALRGINNTFKIYKKQVKVLLNEVMEEMEQMEENIEDAEAALTEDADDSTVAEDMTDLEEQDATDSDEDMDDEDEDRDEDDVDETSGASKQVEELRERAIEKLNELDHKDKEKLLKEINKAEKKVDKAIEKAFEKSNKKDDKKDKKEKKDDKKDKKKDNKKEHGKKH